MHIAVKGKQIDIGESLRQHATQKLDEISQKFFDQSIESTVNFSHEGPLHRCDIHMKVPGITLNAHAVDADIYAVFDAAASKIMQRLKRYKSRLKDHHKSAAPIRSVKYVIENNWDQLAELPPVEQPEAPTIIAELENELRTLSVSQAIMHLDMGDQPAMMFYNSQTGHLGMVYRRTDGHIGWVEPNSSSKQSEAA